MISNLIIFVSMPASQTPPPPGAMELPRLAAEIVRCLRTTIDRRLKPLGLSDARWHAMHQLSHGPADMSQAELASRLGIEAPTLARLLDRLAADGWIERRASSSDRRIKTVHLLPKGTAVIGQIDHTISAAVEELLIGLSANELKQCILTLQKIRERASRAARG